MKNLAITIIILTSLTACDMFRQDYQANGGRHLLWDPDPLFMSKLPQGDDPYSQGFRDGCNTAIGFVGTGYMRTHGFAFDVNRGLESKEYYRGSRIGNNYCTYYMDPDPL